MANTKTNNAKQTKANTPTIEARIEELVNNNSHVKARASINIGGAFAIRNLTVIEGKNGLFVNMPQRSYTDKFAEQHHSDVVFPVTPEAREAVNTAVIDKYNEALAQAEAESQNASSEEDFEEILDEDEGLSPTM